MALLVLAGGHLVSYPAARNLRRRRQRRRRPRRRRPAPPAPPEPVDLGATLGLDSLADCARSAALASILDRWSGSTRDLRKPARRADRGAGLRPAAGPDVRADARGSTAIPTSARSTPISTFPAAGTGSRSPASGGASMRRATPPSFEIRFAEPPERVRETLGRHGFRLPAVGELRESGRRRGSRRCIGVERIEGGAALTCATGERTRAPPPQHHRRLGGQSRRMVRLVHLRRLRALFRAGLLSGRRPRPSQLLEHRRDLRGRLRDAADRGVDDGHLCRQQGAQGGADALGQPDVRGLAGDRGDAELCPDRRRWRRPCSCSPGCCRASASAANMAPARPI